MLSNSVPNRVPLRGRMPTLRFAATPQGGKNTVYIYNGPGASQDGVRQITLSLRQTLPPGYVIKTLDAPGILARHWVQDAALLVMPGGADLPYAQQLNGAGNRIIKDFVRNGGAYLGICAGAYYASDSVEFDKDGPLRVLGKRELGFFPDKAVGPVLAGYDYRSFRGARAARLSLSPALGLNAPEVDVFVNGGPYFNRAAEYSNVEVLASYQQTGPAQPAIVKVNCGQGVAILSGVHLECRAEHLDGHDAFMQPIIQALRAAEPLRQKLVRTLLSLLRLPGEPG